MLSLTCLMLRRKDLQCPQGGLASESHRVVPIIQKAASLNPRLRINPIRCCVESQIADQNASGNWRDLMLFQIDRTRRMLLTGAPLGRTLPGRIGLELRMIVMGGNRILEKLRASGGDVFRDRPALSSFDWVRMLYRSLLAYR